MIPPKTLELFKKALQKLSACIATLQASRQAAPAAPTAMQTPIPTTVPSQPPPTTPTPNPDALQSPWSDPVIAHHNVRALCDLEGLTGTELINGHHWLKKDIVAACVYQESEFKIGARHANTVLHDTGEKDANGKPIYVRQVSSTDFSIVQVNDYWHIGPHKDFPSVEYVLENPEVCVRWMIRYYIEHGNLKAWSSYSTGAFKRWLGKV